MITEEDIDASIAEDDASEQNAPGFLEKFGIAQDRLLRNLNTGIADFAGLPKLISDVTSKIRSSQIPKAVASGLTTIAEVPGVKQVAGKVFDSIPEGATGGSTLADIPFPTSNQAQEFFADHGMAYPVGQEPDDVFDRTVRNIGASLPLLPFLPVGGAGTGAVRGTQAALIEFLGAFGGAVGGKALENSEFGQNNPEMARAVGELGGGLGGGLSVSMAKFLVKGGNIGLLFRVLKSMVPGHRSRILKRLKGLDPELDLGIAELERTSKTLGEGSLLPGQAAGTEGQARLLKAAELEEPAIATLVSKQRSEAIRKFEKIFVGDGKGKGTIADARKLFDEKRIQLSNRANAALRRIDKGGDPGKISVEVEKMLREGLEEIREAESSIWSNLPSGNVSGSRVKEVFAKIIKKNDKSDIIPHLTSRLGSKGKDRLFKGRLSAGAIIEETASSQKVFQLYSLLGRQIDKLSRVGGSSNKIRIVTKIRKALLKDIETAGLGDAYQEALEFSRNKVNKVFTEGAVGKILGFSSGATPSPIEAVQDILGSGGLKTREAIDQALKASPEVKTQIQDYLRNMIVVASKNTDNNRLNANTANDLLGKWDDTLDFFPELRTQIKEAVINQRSLDQMEGVGKISDLSPLTSNQIAASIFLNTDPGAELRRIMDNLSIDRTSFFKDIVKQVKKDETGKAFEGVQHAFGEQLIRKSKSIETGRISGDKLLNNIEELEQVVKKSGLFTEKHIERLKNIADAFKKIEFQRTIDAPKGGVINDPTAKLLSLPLRVLAARAGGELSKGTAGGSIQTANIMTGEAAGLAKKLTNDQARKLLLKAVLDRDLMLDLMKDASAMTHPKRQALYNRILEKANILIPNVPRVPATALAPPAVSLEAQAQESREDEELKRLIRTRNRRLKVSGN